MICKLPSPAAFTEDRRGPARLKFFPRKNLDGYALLLALVIVSAVLSAASALARIVLSEIRQTRELVDSIQAYGQAESLSETALFLVRNRESLDDAQGAFPSGVTVEEAAEAQYFTIEDSDFVSLPIPLSQGREQVNPRIIEWTPQAQCADVSWIEITTISWNQGPPADEDPFQFQHYQFSRGSNFNAVSGSDIIQFPPGIPTEMRVRALFCGIERLGISGIPGRLRVASSATEKGVRQTIETYIPQRAPVSGLFDFVIFSEEEIVKN
ncbi:hypothetical protein HYW17_04555 [Candidatus Uhrbacteria bacterium]|nr:hypothetical protein [Candidatus Uhrbacteria bacterium]